MNQQPTQVKGFLKTNIIPILLLVYFMRFAIPQGSFQTFTLTWFFYSFTLLFVLGYLVIIGITGIVGLVKSRSQNVSISPRHKSFLFLSLFGLVLFGFSLVSRYVYMHKEFDVGLWNNKTVSLHFDDNLITPRQKMMEDLAENVLPGLNKIEIESLLGTPDYSWQPEEGGLNFMYIVGPEKGLGVDFQCLEIQFDENNFFQNYEDVHCG